MISNVYTYGTNIPDFKHPSDKKPFSPESLLRDFKVAQDFLYQTAQYKYIRILPTDFNICIYNANYFLYKKNTFIFYYQEYNAARLRQRHQGQSPICAFPTTRPGRPRT